MELLNLYGWFREGGMSEKVHGAFWAAERMGDEIEITYSLNEGETEGGSFKVPFTVEGRGQAIAQLSLIYG